MAGGEVKYRLVADASAFSQGLRTAAQEFDSFGKTILGGIGLGAGFSVGKESAEALMAVVRGIPAAFLDASKAAVDYASTIQDASDRTHVAAEGLQALKIAAEAADVDFPTLTAGLGRLEKAIGNGSDAFRKLGLSAQSLSKMSPDEAFLTVGDALVRITDTSKQAAIGAELFGKSWQKYLTLFQSNARAVEEQARRLGLVMKAELVSSLEVLGDKAGLLTSTWEHLWINLGAGIASSPAVRASIEALTEAVGALSKRIQDSTPEIAALTTAGFNVAAEGLKSMANTGIGALVVMNDLKNAATLMASPFLLVGEAIDGTVRALQRLAQVGPQGIMMGAPGSPTGVRGLLGGGGGHALINTVANVMPGGSTIAGLLGMPGFGLSGYGAAQGAIAGAQGAPGISYLEDLKKRVEAAQAAWAKFAGDLNKPVVPGGAGGGGLSEAMQKLLDSYTGADAQKKLGEMTTLWALHSAEISKNREGLRAFLADYDKLAQRAGSTLRGADLLSPAMPGLPNYHGITQGLFLSSPGNYNMTGGVPSGPTMPGVLNPNLRGIDLQGPQEADWANRAADAHKKAAEAAADWAQRLAGVANLLGSLSQLMAQLGVATDSAGARVVAGLGAMAQGASTFMQGLGSGNALQMGAGIIQGLGGAIETLGGLFGGSTAAERLAERLRQDGVIAGAILGHSITDQMRQTIQDDARRLNITIEAAAMLHISDSGGDPSQLGGPIMGLLSGIALGVVPAREGLEQVASAFGQLVEAAEAGSQTARDGVNAVVEFTAQTHMQIAAVMEYVRARVVESSDALVTLFDQVEAGSEGAGEQLALFGGIVADNFSKMRGQGFSLVQIFNAMGPSIDAAIEAFERAGIAIPESLAQMKGLSDWVKNNEALVTGLDAFHTVLRQIVQDGKMSEESLRGFEAGLRGIYDRLVDSNLPMPEILRILGPTLRIIHDGAIRGGYALNEFTQGLYEAADAAGTLGGEDPMEQMAGSMRDLVGIMGQLAIHFGVTLPAALLETIREWEEFNRVSRGGPPRPGGPAGPPDPNRAVPGAPEPPSTTATGGLFRRPQTRIIAEAGPELLTPLPYLDRMVEQIVSRVKNETASSAGGGDTINGGITIRIDGARDPRVIANEVVAAIRGNYRNKDGIGVRTALVLTGPR